MPGLDWLTARPVAHRGLHDASAGIIENTASAFAAAIAGNYGIECDLQISADGEAFVHHDDRLGRLTEGDEWLADMNTAEIKAVRFRATSNRIMTLGELCDLVAGRSTLVIELKSHFDGDRRLCERTTKVLASYAGPVTVMSFDPVQVAAIRQIAPRLPRGIVAQRHYDDWEDLQRRERRQLAWFLHVNTTRPQFAAYRIGDLPALVPRVAHHLFGLPLLAWTVRTEDERQRAARWADQIIFEGLRP
jgi:glycerophosphoryl diester phosphodiesterase